MVFGEARMGYECNMSIPNEKFERILISNRTVASPIRPLSDIFENRRFELPHAPHDSYPFEIREPMHRSNILLGKE